MPLWQIRLTISRRRNFGALGKPSHCQNGIFSRGRGQVKLATVRIVARPENWGRADGGCLIVPVPPRLGWLSGLHLWDRGKAPAADASPALCAASRAEYRALRRSSPTSGPTVTGQEIFATRIGQTGMTALEGQKLPMRKPFLKCLYDSKGQPGLLSGVVD